MHHCGRGVRSTVPAAFVALAIAVTAALLLAGCTDDGPGAPAATTAPSVTTTAAGTTSTGSATTTRPASPTTAAPATTSPATSSTARPTTTGVAPPAVTDVRAGPGGGSGEVSVTWRGVTGATRYRVERAPAAAGPFEIAATFDVATGAATRAPGVTNVYAASDGSFLLVDVVTGVTNAGIVRWYRVTAEGSGGAAAPSRAVCGAPPGAPAC
jgi:hypothetical protein